MNEPWIRPLRSETTLALCLLTLSVLGHLFLLSARGSAGVVGGDEGTFLAMTESLALDGDIVFGEPDLERLEAASQPGRKAVILQAYGDRTAYSKPVLYPLLAAPWFRLAGPGGVIALNLAALAGALLLAWGVLVRWGHGRPALTVATLCGTSVVIGYTAWTMSDSVQASLVLAGLALGLGGARPNAGSASGGLAGRLAALFDRPWAPYLGVVLLSMTAAMRLPNLALAGAPVLAWALRRDLRRSLLLALTVAAAAGASFAPNAGLGGALMPYKAVRATFNPVSGYPVGEAAEEAKLQFSEEVALATQTVGLLPAFDPEVSAYAAFYFLAGRHTGLLWYFPAILALALAALGRRDGVSWAVIASTGALGVFYLAWMPNNYFGGAAFLGNRYFLTGYVALLFLPARGPSRRSLLAVWVLALVVFGSACVSVLTTRELDDSSQSHAYAGLFRWLPYETTARDIAGRRDLYWAVEFFRFVDPFAIVDSAGFTLVQDAPPAEIVHASRRGALVARFLARSDSGSGRVIYRGAGGAHSFDLEPAANGSRGLLEIELGEARVRHRYWFEPPERMHTRRHRIRFEQSESGSDETPRSVELYYLGSTRLVPKFYRGVIMSGTLPAEAEAGGATTVPLRLRNTGYRPWAREGTVPTRVGYRIFRAPRADGDREIRSRAVDFEGATPRAHEIDVELQIRWPRRAGEYELVVDLELGGAIWFEEWNQAPLGRATVAVLPPEADHDRE